MTRYPDENLLIALTSADSVYTYCLLLLGYLPTYLPQVPSITSAQDMLNKTLPFKSSVCKNRSKHKYGF